MILVHKGFDKLEVAFQCQISQEFMAALDAKQEEARSFRQPCLLEFNGVLMLVREGGARGGFAYSVDTGPEGGNWVFKRPNPNDMWAARVSVHALPLMLYGIRDVKRSLYAFLERVGFYIVDGGESIGRIDYAMDFLMAGFVLKPENFVMHSHMNRRDHIEDLTRNGTSGTVTSVTVGKMPGRQAILYDKTREIAASGKTHMTLIWNTNLSAQGLPEIASDERVWRLEARLGKHEFKKRWQVSTWGSVDQVLGDMFFSLMDGVRYTEPTNDTNRARWPNHPIWTSAREELSADLHEMTCHALPSDVMSVIREEHAEMMRKQMQGLTIAYAVTMGYGASDVDAYPELIESTLQEAVNRERQRIEKKFDRTQRRLAFV